MVFTINDIVRINNTVTQAQPNVSDMQKQKQLSSGRIFQGLRGSFLGSSHRPVLKTIPFLVMCRFKQPKPAKLIFSFTRLNFLFLKRQSCSFSFLNCHITCLQLGILSLPNSILLKAHLCQEIFFFFYVFTVLLSGLHPLIYYILHDRHMAHRLHRENKGTQGKKQKDQGTRLSANWKKVYSWE